MKLIQVSALAISAGLALSGCTSSEAVPQIAETTVSAVPVQVGLERIETVSTTKGLVSTAELADLEDENLVLLHIANEEGLYERGHIPGALKVDWFSSLTGGEERGIVAQDDFTALAQSLGINEDSSVVVYGETHQLFATWAVWVFKIYGFENVRLLDGGFAKWQAEERPLEIQTRSVVPGNFVAESANSDLRALIDEVVAAVSDENDNKIIVDNRNYESYTGASESGAKYDGHVASAENLFSFGLFSEDGSYLPAPEIAERYRAIGVTGAEEAILYCGTGLLASASWFALTQILGYENVQNYDGSWTEYGNTDGVPIESEAS